MKKYRKGGIVGNDTFFICTSEKETELVGTLGEKCIPHTSEQVSKIIAESIKEAVEKEVGTVWQNEYLEQHYLLTV